MMFKVGDKVKRLPEYTNKDSKTPLNGEVWKIVNMEYDEGDKTTYLSFEGDEISKHNPEWDAFAFELVESYSPDEAKPPEVVALGEQLVATEWTDKHYDFSYQLTQQDIENGFVKVDPYFVARIWQLGKKDDSGVLFHNLKNISRYGEKNSKEREIRALYAQIKRLAELEEIEL